ncbi:nucleoside-diphosphate sugar epimerase/dehydratase, partial [Pseudomonas sp. SDO5511_1_S431]
MRDKSSVDSLFLTRAGFIEFFVVFVKLIHGATAILPALVLAFYPEPMAPELRSHFLGLLVFFAVLTLILFHALGVYSEELFSNRLRFRTMLVAWSSAFCILLFMYQILAMFPQFNPRNLVVWYIASLALFGLERVLMLRLYRHLMKGGKYLQRTVILGFTDTAVHVADHLRRNGDIRSGLIGFIDDRTERIPKELSNLPLLGNTRDLEKLIRSEQVNQVMITLPWAAEQRIHGLVKRLRQMSVNVMLVPDMAALRYCTVFEIIYLLTTASSASR